MGAPAETPHQPNKLERIIKDTLYDSDKGGIRFAGIAGLIGGLFAGMKLAEGAPSPGWGLATIAIMTLSFGWGAGKLGDAATTYLNRPGSRTPTPELGQARAPELTTASVKTSPEPELGQLPSPVIARAADPLAAQQTGLGC